MSAVPSRLSPSHAQPHAAPARATPVPNSSTSYTGAVGYDRYLWRDAPAPARSAPPQHAPVSVASPVAHHAAATKSTLVPKPARPGVLKRSAQALQRVPSRLPWTCGALVGAGCSMKILAYAGIATAVSLPWAAGIACLTGAAWRAWAKRTPSAVAAPALAPVSAATVAHAKMEAVVSPQAAPVRAPTPSLAQRAADGVSRPVHASLLAGFAWPLAAGVGLASWCATGLGLRLLAPAQKVTSAVAAPKSALERAVAAGASQLGRLWRNPFQMAVAAGLGTLLGGFALPAFAGTVLQSKLLASAGAAALGFVVSVLTSARPGHLAVAGGSGAVVGLAAGLGLLAYGLPGPVSAALGAACGVVTALLAFGACTLSTGQRLAVCSLLLLVGGGWLLLTPKGAALVALLRARLAPGAPGAV